MNGLQWNAVADALLRKYFLISLADTGLALEAYEDPEVEPYVAVNEWAEHFELCRADTDWNLYKPLTLKEQLTVH